MHGRKSSPHSAIQWEPANREDLADLDDDVAHEEELHFSDQCHQDRNERQQDRAQVRQIPITAQRDARQLTPSISIPSPCRRLREEVTDRQRRVRAARISAKVVERAVSCGRHGCRMAVDRVAGSLTGAYNNERQSVCFLSFPGNERWRYKGMEKQRSANCSRGVERDGRREVQELAGLAPQEGLARRCEDAAVNNSIDDMGSGFQVIGVAGETDSRKLAARWEESAGMEQGCAPLPEPVRSVRSVAGTDIMQRTCSLERRRHAVTTQRTATHPVRYDTGLLVGRPALRGPSSATHSVVECAPFALVVSPSNSDHGIPAACPHDRKSLNMRLSASSIGPLRYWLALPIFADSCSWSSFSLGSFELHCAALGVDRQHGLSYVAIVAFRRHLGPKLSSRGQQSPLDLKIDSLRTYNEPGDLPLISLMMVSHNLVISSLRSEDICLW
ncbi:hypothetical protein KC356_g135 [Hortaea werneckii]|nr:hypothetical protein KC356_g135 [Hortaea werneckii]